MRRISGITVVVLMAFAMLSCIGNKPDADDAQHLTSAAESAKSLPHYRQRMTFTSQQARTFCDRGIALHEKGKHASAKQLLLKALELEPENAIVLTGLGHVSHASKNYADALEYYNRSHIVYDADRLNAGVHLGRSYYLNGDYEKCIIVSKYTAAHASDEKSYFLSCYNLTKALIKTGRCEEARQSFKETKPAMVMFKDLTSRIDVLEHELGNCEAL